MRRSKEQSPLAGCLNVSFGSEFPSLPVQEGTRGMLARLLTHPASLARSTSKRGDPSLFRTGQVFCASFYSEE